jgi:hypothetical protein
MGSPFGKSMEWRKTSNPLTESEFFSSHQQSAGLWYLLNENYLERLGLFESFRIFGSLIQC